MIIISTKEMIIKSLKRFGWINGLILPAIVIAIAGVAQLCIDTINEMGIKLTSEMIIAFSLVWIAYIATRIKN